LYRIPKTNIVASLLYNSIDVQGHRLKVRVTRVLGVFLCA